MSSNARRDAIRTQNRINLVDKAAEPVIIGDWTWHPPPLIGSGAVTIHRVIINHLTMFDDSRVSPAAMFRSWEIIEDVFTQWYKTSNMPVEMFAPSHKRSFGELYRLIQIGIVRRNMIKGQGTYTLVNIKAAHEYLDLLEEGERDAKREKVEAVSSPPAPRLVGIELNPGPPDCTTCPPAAGCDGIRCKKPVAIQPTAMVAQVSSN
jgi:hypothetical protein